MYDFSEFFKAGAENGPVVLALVVGLTTFLGQFGIEGKWQKLAALILGVIFGGALQIAALALPGDFSGWFGLVCYGLVMGLTASGAYDTAKKLLAGSHPEG